VVGASMLPIATEAMVEQPGGQRTGSVVFSSFLCSNVAVFAQELRIDD